jgi:hypothetical protein
VGPSVLDTRNIVDGGIQSSRLGVDVWNIPKPQYRPNMNTTIHDFPINLFNTGAADLIVCNNSWRKNKKRQNFHSSMEVDINSDFQ